ncbi:MAG: LysM peptidoglycan-binding domain-containing protein [Candidatus Roizmanbacteria bacterium]
MSPPHESDNAYVSELKSLLKDKFFMMLLGISVAIVILSTFYSFIRPKNTGTSELTAQSASTEVVTPMVVAKEESTKKDATDANVVVQATIKPTLAAQIIVTPTSSVSNDFVGLDSALSVDELNGLDKVVSPTQAPKLGLFDRIKGLFGKSKPEVTSTPAADMSLEPTTSVTGAQTAVNEPAVVKPVVGKQYTVVEGDSLWSIAEKTYGSGYNFVDIASASKLVDADSLAVGQKITLPTVQPKASTVIGSINGNGASTKNADSIPATYTVSQGDNLWNIAASQYNNGYEWTKIATLNNLKYPDFINAGQVLKLK